jgi:hypothetical protein
VVLVQVRLWHLSVVLELTMDRLPRIEEWGWKWEEGTFVHVWGTMEPAPDMLMKGSACNCRKTHCKTSQCSCKK